ncbi:unnamed protein product, partial [Prorocentrum cordatum]
MGPPPSPPREAARAEPDKKPERGGDYLIQIFQPPEKRVKKVEQEWKCIEDVTNPRLKAAFLQMYGSGGPPSPDVDQCDYRHPKRATFKVTLEVETEW